MNTTVSGIPCQAHVVSFDPGYAAKTGSEPDDCYQGEVRAIEFVLRDRRGRDAPWLEAKLTMAERGRIENELFEELT